MNTAKELLRIRKEYGYRDEDKRIFSRTVLKLCNDRLTLTDCYPRRIRFKRFNEDYKVDVESGELFPYDFSDCKRQVRNLETSVSRAKRSIEDICLKNSFDFFVTVTFNRKFVDRYSAEAVQRLFSCVMKRLRRKFGKTSFVAVPEYHKDGAIHYHCFMKFERQPKLLYSRTIKAYFFTDEFKKDDCFLVAEKVEKGLPTGYLKKYINKNMERPLYRRFSCSRDLKRSKVLKSVDVTEKVSLFRYVVQNKGFKLWTENKFARSFRYVVHDGGEGDGARSAPPSPSADSSIHDINDRNEYLLRRIYDAILDEVRLLDALSHDGNAVIENNGSAFKVGGKCQLSFLFN